MATKTHVFASRPERENYYKLSRQWGETYHIYHNLPFLNVFNTRDLVDTQKLWDWTSLFGARESFSLSISDVDYNRLKKTSIDYTLCDQNDKAIVCIDFDGLKDGFNVGTEYRYDGPPDPWRDLITGLKLKVAHGSMFSYFVVGSRHFEELSDSVQLTIVDGIIGEVLANLETGDRIAGGFKPEEMGFTQDEFNDLGPDEQHDVIQDWVIGVEVEAELNHNPISVRVCELEREVGLNWSLTWLSYPDADAAKTLPERRRLLNNATSTGCRCKLTRGVFVADGKISDVPPECGEITATVWLPNFKTPGCSSMLGLAENLSKLIALEKAKKLMGKREC